jgi:hypothetical protein
VSTSLHAYADVSHPTQEGINGSFALWYAVLLFKNAQRELEADEKLIFALV